MSCCTPGRPDGPHDGAQLSTRDSPETGAEVSGLGGSDSRAGDLASRAEDANPRPGAPSFGAGGSASGADVSGLGGSDTRAEDSPSRPELIVLPGGWFTMGTDSDEGFPADGEGPARRVWVDPFSIGRYAVTNEEFAAFVDATGYRTEAEEFGWSFVFHLFVSKQARKRNEVRAVEGLDWWLGVMRACWKRPEGRGSNLKGRENHPVVHVSWNDAIAYCDWAGVRLATEAEWEYAARGGTEGQNFPWGEELELGGSYHCNTWQGNFPARNTKGDGYAGTAPVDSFEPNGYGLYNVCGNVWEWCADWFSPSYHKTESEATRVSPKGPPGGSARVTRGGSYLCHHSYCNRYRLPARSSNTPESSTGNTGFRVAKSRV